MPALREQIRNAGLKLGFCRVGFAPLSPLPHQQQFQDWLACGHQAQMDFLAQSSTQRFNPSSIFPSARTAIVAAMTYAAPPRAEMLSAPDPANRRVLIARYAAGADYHIILRRQLQSLLDEIRTIANMPVDGLAAVDTLPLAERELAVAAGLGFIGLNNLLIIPGIGSFFVLGTLLISLELPPDNPPQSPTKSPCGRCRRCLTACPTGALGAPHSLDARRCVSYLTIEHRGPLDADLAPWIFGCDACQEACPYNARALRHSFTPSPLDLAAPKIFSLPLDDALTMRSSYYRRLIEGRALRRLSRANWVRNAEALAKHSA